MHPLQFLLHLEHLLALLLLVVLDIASHDLVSDVRQGRHLYLALMVDVRHQELAQLLFLRVFSCMPALVLWVSLCHLGRWLMLTSSASLFVRESCFGIRRVITR